MTMEMDPRVYDPAQDLTAQTRATRAKHTGPVNIDPDADLKVAQVTQALTAGKRAFVAPVHQNSHILIHAGKPTTCYAGSDQPAIPGMPATAGVEVRRIGDIFIDFTGGIGIFDPEDEADAIRIAWCEANPDAARDAFDPQTDIWANLKEGQLNKSTKEPSIDQGMDVDAVMRGDYATLNRSGSIAARARAIVAGEAAPTAAARY